VINTKKAVDTSLSGPYVLVMCGVSHQIYHIGLEMYFYCMFCILGKLFVETVSISV